MTGKERPPLSNYQLGLLKFKVYRAYQIAQHSPIPEISVEIESALNLENEELNLITRSIGSNILLKTVKKIFNHNIFEENKPKREFSQNSIDCFNTYINRLIADIKPLEEEFYIYFQNHVKKKQNDLEHETSDRQTLGRNKRNPSWNNFNKTKVIKIAAISFIAIFLGFLVSRLYADDPLKEYLIIIDKKVEPNSFDTTKITDFNEVYIFIDSLVYKRYLFKDLDTLRFRLNKDSIHYIVFRSPDGKYHNHFNLYPEDTIVWNVRSNNIHHVYFPIKSIPLNLSFGINKNYKAETGYLIKFINDKKNPYYYGFLSVDDGVGTLGSRNPMGGPMAIEVNPDGSYNEDSILDEYTSEDLTIFDHDNVTVFVKDVSFRIILDLFSKDEKVTVRKLFNLNGSYFVKQRNIVYKIYLSDLLDPKKNYEFEIW